jgi:PIN domain nuclease of toxin-antitoxin system
MKLLLDSHVFIWSYDEKHKIPVSVMGELSNPANQLYLSIAGLWELQIKIQIGKLTLQTPFDEIIAEQQIVNGFQILPVELSHILYLENLVSHHNDPSTGC